MKKSIRFTALALVSASLFLACGKNSEPVNKEEQKPEEETQQPVTHPSFYYGADVSWASEMEHDGKTFKNASGTTQDIFVILKGLGQNITRLRVWVDPSRGGWCGYDDVLAKAKRAKAAGLEIMIDFHYSDFFADPGRQDTPAAWQSLNHANLVTRVNDYTKEVLTGLKQQGITPSYVQVGNETRVGMLWPDGKIANTGIVSNYSNYAELSNAGYDAVKAIFPEAKVIVHLNNAYQDLEWWFSNFTNAGGKMDVIGLSHYPQGISGKTWQQANDGAIDNINNLINKFNKDVFVVETGIKNDNLSEGVTILTDFITKIRQISRCKGILYWEPEVYGWWKPAIYTTLGWNAYDMGVFNSDGSPSDVVKLFKPAQ